jgi:ATP-citrate lyase beta-subunit
MPRRKISEYSAKTIVAKAFGIPYAGWTVDSDDVDRQLEAIDGYDSYVVKVDQAVKGRFKAGLVALEVEKQDLRVRIQEFVAKGYSTFIVEPFAKHEENEERYLSVTKDAKGLALHVSAKGGVDIESHAETIQSVIIDETVDWSDAAGRTGLTSDQLQTLVRIFNENYFVFLEINPYVVSGDSLKLLDLAVEVDDAASLLVSEWTTDDFRTPPRVLSEQEQAVTQLNETSPASFNLQMINPDGAFFLLLSGGGASVVIADEIYSAGYGKELANYGEYSGNPTREETRVYASAVVTLLLASKAPKKVLFIGGAVANFTNIEKTFAGIIDVIDEYAEKLASQHVKVVVRRGGPHQEAGLRNMQTALEKYGLLGAVHNQRTPIGDAVKGAIKEISQ